MITGYFGLPGCGKSTFLAMIAQKYIEKGYRVFVNREYPIHGCYLFDWSDIGQYDMSDSLILIDEVSLYADNRDFKTFLQGVKQYFILHRHYCCDIIWCTQQYDGVDRKIRELTTCLYYVRILGKISYAMRVNRFIHIHKEEKDIRTGYKLSNIFLMLFAYLNQSLKICYRPKYYKYFDSFKCPKLPVKDFDYFEISEIKKKPKIKKAA